MRVGLALGVRSGGGGDGEGEGPTCVSRIIMLSIHCSSGRICEALVQQQSLGSRPCTSCCRAVGSPAAAGSSSCRSSPDAAATVQNEQEGQEQQQEGKGRCMVLWQINSACVAGVHTPAKPVSGRHVVGAVML